jgi:hypothetical protein
MKRVLIPIVLFSLFSAQPLITSAQTPQEIRQQLQQYINELKKQITDQEKQIAEAKKKEDAETIKGMEDELGLKHENILSGMIQKNYSQEALKLLNDIQKLVEQTWSQRFKKAFEENFPIEKLQAMIDK